MQKITLLFTFLSLLCLNLNAQSETITFSGPTTQNIGTSVSDNLNINGTTSNDIQGIDIDIYGAMQNSPSANSGSLVYYTSDATGINKNIVGLIDITSGLAITNEANLPRILVIKSHDGSEFNFKSIYVTDIFDQKNSIIKFVGFRNGASTGSVQLNINQNTFEETFTSSTLTPSIFQNVDEVRITNCTGGEYNYGIYACFNDIEIGPPVLPSPSVTSVTVPTNATYKIGDALNFTVNYDQAVTVTGTPQLPITLNTGGTVNASYVAGSGTSSLLFRYTVASGNLDADGISVGSALLLNGGTIKNGSATDAVLTLYGMNATAGIKVDGVRPTAAITMSDVALKVGETSTLTFTFSEAVTGFTTADLTVANGSVTGLSSGDGGITWTATFTPSASVTAATNLITLDNTGFTDVTGNAGTGNTTSPNYAIDTLRPTATITMSDAALKYGETSTVTFTFSEAVTDFATDDVTAANGSLSNLTSGDGGITWTATFTPSSSVTDATNVIIVNNAGVTDLAGNAGTGSSSSVNYNIDTQRPTATIALSDAALKTGETSTVTFTFSEWITGFQLGAISATNGTVSNLSTTDNITWTATFTPKASTTSGGNAIVILLHAISDAAGNSGINIVSSPNYTVDTQNPTATITSTTSEPTSLTTIPVTVTFSESVANFAEGDITLTNATISAFAGSGTNYTFTVTPSSQGLVTVAIAASVAQDAAGNNNTAATSLTRTFDSVNPTVVLSTTAPSSTNAAILVTATFSEDVTGLSLSDFSVTNATLSALSGSGKTYTFTATPSAQGSVSISLPSASVLDAAQLGNVASDQLNRTFDNVAPIISGVTDGGNYSSAAYPTYNEGTGSISSNVTSTWYYPPTGGSVTMQGDFTLVVTDAAGNSTTVSFTVSIATQTEQKESAGYLLYPNPCSEGFHINVGNQTIELTITDLTGRLVLHQIVTDKDYVPTSQLKAGIYIVKAGNFVTRLIVK